MSVGRYFDVKVAFSDEVIFDDADVSSAAERFEKAFILELRARLPDDLEADIRLYGNPTAGCFFDAVWVFVGGMTTTASLLAIGGNQLLEAIEASVFAVWHGNISEMRARVGTAVVDPPEDIRNKPPEGPFETLVRVPSQNARVRERSGVGDQTLDATPTSSPDSQRAITRPTLTLTQVALILFALLAGVGYAAQRMSDAQDMRELTDRLSRIEAAIGDEPPPTLRVECHAPEVKLSCPSAPSRPPPRRYTSSRSP